MSQNAPEPTPAPISLFTTEAPDNIAVYGAVQDSLLESSTANMGSSDTLIVAKHTDYPLKRSLVQFETPENRDGMSIVCARVELFFTYAHRASWQTNEPWVDRDVTIGAVMMPWNERQVTTTIAETGTLWPVDATNPDFLHNPDVVQQSTETIHTVCEGNRSHWTSWDVTAMAREWAAGSLANNGVILWATNEAVNGRDLRFAARETSNATIRPVLQVAYGEGTNPDADCSVFEDWSNVCASDAQPPTAPPILPPTTAPTQAPTPEPTPAPISLFTTEAPDNIAVYGAVQDSLLESSTANMGSSDTLIVAKHTGFPLKRSLVQFETPENRDGMSIVCARVELFFTYAHRASWQTNEPWVDRDVTIGAVMMPWNERQVTTTIAETGTLWPVDATNPDFLHNPDVVQQSTETIHTVCEGNRSHWTSWDVTAMAREWAAGSLANNGVILWATNEAVNGRDLRFAARETSNATIRPVLQVAYGEGTNPDADCSVFEDWSNVCASDAQPPTAPPILPPTTAPTVVFESTLVTATMTNAVTFEAPTLTAVLESTTVSAMVTQPVALDTNSDGSAANDEDNSSSSLTWIIVVVTVLLLCLVLVAVFVWRAKQNPSRSDSRGIPAFQNPAYTQYAAGNHGHAPVVYMDSDSVAEPSDAQTARSDAMFANPTYSSTTASDEMYSDPHAVSAVASLA